MADILRDRRFAPSVVCTDTDNIVNVQPDPETGANQKSSESAGCLETHSSSVEEGSPLLKAAAVSTVKKLMIEVSEKAAGLTSSP